MPRSFPGHFTVGGRPAFIPVQICFAKFKSAEVDLIKCVEMKKLFLLCILLVITIKASSQTGNAGLDPAFAEGGIMIDAHFYFHGIMDLALQADGKIVVAGTDYIARYSSNGTPDSSFGQAGYITAGGPTHLLVLPDGKILLTLDEKSLVVRLKPDGTLDSSFGEAGKISTCCDYIKAALQPDGKLLLAGSSYSSPYLGAHRITQAGVTDSTYGTNGLTNIKVSFPLTVTGIGVMTDGRIGIVGEDAENVFYLRYKADGILDSSVCNSGLCLSFRALFQQAIGRRSKDAIVYPNGEALIAVEGNLEDSSFLVKLKANATPDSSFGTVGNGQLTISGFHIKSIYQTADGRILCAGMLSSNLAIIRILKDGKGIDSTFGNQGIIETQIPTATYTTAYTLVLQPDYKILVGGTTIMEPGSSMHALIARYLPDAQVGINQVSQAKKGSLKLYPNPAKTTLLVTVPAPGILQLFSTDGRLLQQQHVTGKAQVLDVAMLQQGTYLLRLRTANGSYSSLFVKE